MRAMSAEPSVSDDRSVGSAPEGPPPVHPKDLSIPVAVEPTADLRAPAQPLRPRSSMREADDATGFPRPLAFALVALALVATGLGVRFWAMERDRTQPVEVSQPVVGASDVVYGDIPAGVDVPAGQGLLSISVADEIPVRIDGRESHGARKAQTLRQALSPGVHLVSVGAGEKARSRIIEVRPVRATNINFDEP